MGCKANGGRKNKAMQAVRSNKSNILQNTDRQASSLDEIIDVAHTMDVDLIIMASSRITGSIKIHESITRKVIDSTNKPVLVIHEQK